VHKARRLGSGPQAAWEPAPIEAVCAAIAAEKPAVVCAPHVETAAGMMLPDDYLRAVADAVHAVGGLLVLDCIASGAMWVDMQATGVDADWFASFTVPDQWMADNPPGRYTAQLETACGTQLFAVQKGRAPRLGYHSTVEGVCGDVGAVCVAECPGGSLAFVPLGTELLEPLLTEDGFVLVR
jgi:hypothetical protein